LAGHSTPLLQQQERHDLRQLTDDRSERQSVQLRRTQACVGAAESIRATEICTNNTLSLDVGVAILGRYWNPNDGLQRKSVLNIGTARHSVSIPGAMVATR